MKSGYADAVADCFPNTQHRILPHRRGLIINLRHITPNLDSHFRYLSQGIKAFAPWDLAGAAIAQKFFDHQHPSHATLLQSG